MIEFDVAGNVYLQIFTPILFIKQNPGNKLNTEKNMKMLN